MPCDSKELRRTLSLVLALTALLCTFTLAQSVRTSYTPGVDFSKFHTYKWVEIKGHHPDPSLDSQIKQSIDSKLAARGLTKTGDSADLSVDYQIAISEVEKWEKQEDWNPGPQQDTIDVGTLVIDMYDTAGKLLVWTGRAHKVIDKESRPEDRQKNLDKAAKNLLADFPPK